jgi:BirA family biotin operon repressor/biotin-[acetyl-CoA-carboxylase] ligase
MRHAMPIDLTALPRHIAECVAEWPKVTSSTMIRAAELARAGAAHKTIVGADEQTAGVGRHGRKWLSSAGQGLYASFVLRLGLPPERLPLVMLALGLAARQAIADSSNLKPDLRWPNDVLIDGKKCGGVLAQWEGAALVAGIGINVSQPEFPPNLETPATSLSLAGATVTREKLLEELWNGLEFYCAELGAPKPRIVEWFEAQSSYARGKRVRAERQGTMVEGTTIGLDASGFLIVREDSGKEATILAGGVRPV